MENSRNSSAMAVRNYDEQEETSILATESKPTEWTDEKHSLYLKSMEATFVNQLYKSFDLIGRHSQKNGPSAGTPSGQFKVLRDGYWSKIDFQRDEAQVNQGGESGVVLANPWVRHYRSQPERQPIRKFQTFGTKAPSTATPNQRVAINFPLWQQDSIGNNTEVSDQNFNDEEVEEEKPERTHEIKRTRTSVDMTSSNDQVVPFDDIIQVGDATENRVHPED